MHREAVIGPRVPQHGHVTPTAVPESEIGANRHHFSPESGAEDDIDERLGGPLPYLGEGQYADEFGSLLLKPLHPLVDGAKEPRGSLRIDEAEWMDVEGEGRRHKA